MTLLLSIVSNPTLLAVMGGVLAVLVAFMRGNSRGARLEREKQARAEEKARDIRDEIESDIAALPPEAVREELRRRSRP